MTFDGTNTYLLGHRGIAVIDPGPDDPTHLQAILDALSPDQFISHIIVTHAHLDHSPLSRALSRNVGAPVYGFGLADAGRSAVMKELVKNGYSGGGEGIDYAFIPDRLLSDGDTLNGDGWKLRVIHTPGHIGNHICLAWDDSCFTADHVLGWASSLVSPPDGDLTDFMVSCERLMQEQWRVFYPGHGEPVLSPNDRLEWLIEHRNGRETEILLELSKESLTAAELARRIYTDTPDHLLSAAERNVLAHLIDLIGKSKVRYYGNLAAKSVFELVSPNEE